MTYRMRPICAYCVRFHAGGQGALACDAFPGEIPDSIISSRVDHREPVEGDHGLQFLAKSPEDAKEAADMMDWIHAE